MKHRQQYNDWMQSKHSEVGVMCWDCHNPHRKDGRHEHSALREKGSALCLTCHKNHSFDNWAFSGHNGADVNCSSCHTVHTDFGHSMKKATPQLCYDCHSDVRAAAFMPSHHPVAEGKLSCEDCHGVHGGPGRLTQDKSGRELCFSCHADKEGPFLYEHEPVRENCLLCHDAKGAVTNNLLKANEAVLCLRCHAGHEDAHPRLDSPQQRAAYMTKCTRCHGQIHGSDLPGFVGPSRFIR